MTLAYSRIEPQANSRIEPEAHSLRQHDHQRGAEKERLD